MWLLTMTLAFSFIVAVLFSLNVNASCNPSFMVCADESGYSHWSGSYSSTKINTYNNLKYNKNKSRNDFIDHAVKSCLPYEYHDIMKKIVKVESGGNPFAINVNGGHKLTRQPVNYDEAIHAAKVLIGNGYSIDMGIAQINSQHFSKNGFLHKLGLSVDEIFDVCTNLRAGAKVFGDAYIKNNGNAISALSAYNTGSPVKGITNGYVKKVLSQ